MSRLITSLEHEGLVQRAVDPNDRRVVRVRAMPQGKRVLDEGRQRRIHDLVQSQRGCCAFVGAAPECRPAAAAARPFPIAQQAT
jgi:DNA-binding MarR family transcriptional regulator